MPSHLVLVVSALLCSFADGFVSCLPKGDGIRPENRSNIYINDTAMPLALARSHSPVVVQTITYIYQILMEEVYGIHTTEPSSTQRGFWGVAGCECKTGCVCQNCPAPTCGSLPSFHGVIEDSAITLVQDYLGHRMPTRSPVLLGDLGFEHHLATLMRGSSMREGSAALGLPLDHYRSFNFTDTSRHFSRVSDIPHSRLLACNATNKGRGVWCEKYAAAYHEPGSVHWDGKLCRVTCHGDGYWWFAPACREEPWRCVPMLSASQKWWSAMARATEYNWPVALAAPIDVREAQTLPLDFRVLWNVVAPDDTYRSIEPVEISLPRYEALWGDAKPSYSASTMDKYFYNGWAGEIQGLHGFQAKEVFQRMKLRLEEAEQLSQLFQELYEVAGRPLQMAPTAKEAACLWVTKNEKVWRNWLPLESECALGQGMQTADGAFTEERGLARTCEWCSLGRYSAKRWDELGLTHVCLPCPAGEEQRTSGKAECTACLPGRYKVSEGEELCSDCPPGTATPFPGQQSCPACAPGRAAGERAQLRCLACPPGAAAPLAGSLACSLCERGSFSNDTGSQHCTACSDILAGSTGQRGAEDASNCICPEETYMLPGKGCAPCAQGLTCPGGNSVPLQAKGFWVDVTDAASRDYSIYMCRNVRECPAGSLGTCASGRKDAACNNCEAHYYPAGGGRCLPCETSSLVPFVTFVLAAVFLLSILVAFTKVDATRQHLSLFTTVIVVGQIFTTIQALSAMKQIQVPWPEQLRSLLDVLSLFVFDMELLAMPCVLPSDSPLIKFLVKLMAYPALLLFLFVAFLASKCRGKPLDKVALVNANGTVLLSIYISMTLALALPFQCQGNPSGFLSMATQPGLRCFQDPAHVSLAVLAALGILVYPVGIAAYVAFATFKCKAMAGSVAGVHFIKRFQFLFGRYRPECYRFGLFFLLRNCLVGLVPVVFVTMPVLQINAIALVILAGLVLTVWFQPWRTAWPNRTDTALGMVLVMVVTGVAVLMDNTSEGASVVIGMAMTTALLLCLLGMLLVLLLGLHRYFFPVKHYGIFLCHHKAAAGNLCRLLKLLLEPRTSHEIFIDSDHLDDLDQLFETVRCNVESLVVVLTQNVLARPWCAGEIVTAHRNGVNIVPLAIDDFQALDNEGVRSLTESWSGHDLALLGYYGIQPEMVQEAFNFLLAKEHVRLQRLLPLCKKEMVVSELLGRCRMSAMPALEWLAKTSTGSKVDAYLPEIIGSSAIGGEPEVLVLGLVSDLEALAACEIMQLELQRELEVEVTVVRNGQQLLEDLSTNQVVLVLWSRGILQDPSFANLIHTITEAQCSPQFLTALADPAFQFPGADFLAEVESVGIAGLDPSSGPSLAASYSTLLKQLSRPFDPQRSKAAITEQVKELAGRARKLLQSRQVGTPASAPSAPSSNWSQTLASTARLVMPAYASLEEQPEQPSESGEPLTPCSLEELSGPARDTI